MRSKKPLGDGGGHIVYKIGFGMSAEDGGVRDREGVDKICLNTSFGEEGAPQVWTTNIHFREEGEGGRHFEGLYFRTIDAAREAGGAPLGIPVPRAVFSKRYRLVDPRNPTSKDRVSDFYFPRGEVPSSKMPYACVVYDENWRIGVQGYEDAFLFKTQWMQLAVPPAPQRAEHHRTLVART